jgi:hypothetical protein
MVDNLFEGAQQPLVAVLKSWILYSYVSENKGVNAMVHLLRVGGSTRNLELICVAKPGNWHFSFAGFPG